MVPGALLVGSLIESDAEAGGERGIQARRRLEKIFGRLQSPWLPAQAHEQYEIIRRRLFQELDADAQRERDVTVKAFADLYRFNHRAFPSEAGENSYQDIMARAYPMHPELFRLFAEVWAAGVNERFQQTRGALRLMANVVAALWHAEDAAPLIMPGSIPLSEPRVRAAVLEPLDTHYAAVLDAEVEGDGRPPADHRSAAPRFWPQQSDDPGGARGVHGNRATHRCVAGGRDRTAASAPVRPARRSHQRLRRRCPGTGGKFRLSPSRRRRLLVQYGTDAEPHRLRGRPRPGLRGRGHEARRVAPWRSRRQQVCPRPSDRGN